MSDVIGDFVCYLGQHYGGAIDWSYVHKFGGWPTAESLEEYFDDEEVAKLSHHQRKSLLKGEEIKFFGTSYKLRWIALPESLCNE